MGTFSIVIDNRSTALHDLRLIMRGSRVGFLG